MSAPVRKAIAGCQIQPEPLNPVGNYAREAPSAFVPEHASSGGASVIWLADTSLPEVLSGE
jgi:hypothetical protein